MYAMLWILGAGLAWLSLRLSRRPSDLPTALTWVLAGAAGLLTHYFFAFVWLACVVRHRLGHTLLPRLDRIETEQLLTRHVHVVGARR
jgi:uncharacterized membrane protein